MLNLSCIGLVILYIKENLKFHESSFKRISKELNYERNVYINLNCWDEQILKRNHHVFSLQSNPIRTTWGKGRFSGRKSDGTSCELSHNSNDEPALRVYHFRNVSTSRPLFTLVIWMWELKYVRGRFTFSLCILLLCHLLKWSSTLI